MPRKLILLIIPVIILAAVIGPPLFGKAYFKLSRPVVNRSDPSLTSSPSPVEVQGVWKVSYPQDYTIIMLGDSMTERLGNSDELRAYLSEYYPNKTFQILNYGYGSTNILSLQQRITEETTFGRKFRPVTEIDYDLVLIESMGNNPLSDVSLEEGLIKHNQALDQALQTIRQTSPQAKIAFVATIAPNSEKFGEGAVELAPERRLKWVNERKAYIENHIKYAQEHNIPLINIYQNSMNNSGDGKLEYLSQDDYIHPSPDGIYFISSELARGIAEQHLLP